MEFCSEMKNWIVLDMLIHSGTMGKQHLDHLSVSFSSMLPRISLVASCDMFSVLSPFYKQLLYRWATCDRSIVATLIFPRKHCVIRVLRGKEIYGTHNVRGQHTFRTHSNLRQTKWQKSEGKRRFLFCILHLILSNLSIVLSERLIWRRNCPNFPEHEGSSPYKRPLLYLILIRCNTPQIIISYFSSVHFNIIL